MRKERVDVRVEQELLEELEIIAERSGWTRSAAIREAVAEFVDRHRQGWNTTGIVVNIPNRLADRVTWAIRNGDADDVDHVVEKSLEKWLELREEFYLEKKPRLDRIAAENARNDVAEAEHLQSGKQMARK